MTLALHQEPLAQAIQAAAPVPSAAHLHGRHQNFVKDATCPETRRTAYIRNMPLPAACRSLPTVWSAVSRAASRRCSGCQREEVGDHSWRTTGWSLSGRSRSACSDDRSVIRDDACVRSPKCQCSPCCELCNSRPPVTCGAERNPGGWHQAPASRGPLRRRATPPAPWQVWTDPAAVLQQSKCPSKMPARPCSRRRHRDAHSRGVLAAGDLFFLETKGCPLGSLNACVLVALCSRTSCVPGLG